MQAAADSSALGAAAALLAGNATSYVAEAKATAASYGFVDGASHVAVTVDTPPKTGNFTTNAAAVEVVVAQPQTRLFSALFLASSPTISARAVAMQQSP